jgi:hypothetical protein
MVSDSNDVNFVQWLVIVLLQLCQHFIGLQIPGCLLKRRNENAHKDTDNFFVNT